MLAEKGNHFLKNQIEKSITTEILQLIVKINTFDKSLAKIIKKGKLEK